MVRLLSVIAKRLPRIWGAWHLLAALGAAIIVAATGLSSGPEAQFRLLRDEFRLAEASKSVVLVEIDARSLQTMGRWPWPRSFHGRLVDQLSGAQPSLIAFDVDFSALSTPAEDSAFAAALARSKTPVALPTFRQGGSNGHADNDVENLPAVPFRPHVILASVNVQPGRDGRLVDYAFGTTTGGVARPSIAALVAGSTGAVGNSFRIDSAIDPATIPRLSASDVLAGRFDPAVIHGRAVIVGATAIEMGDRYMLPLHGIQPGAVAQAMAAETLIAGGAAAGWGPEGPLLATLAILLALSRCRFEKLAAPCTMIIAVVLAALPFLLEAFARTTVAVVPAMTLFGVDLALRRGAALVRSWRRDRDVDPFTGLPNLRAFVRGLASQQQIVVVVARLLRFETIEAVTDESGRREVAARMIDRLTLAFPDATFFSVAPGTFAWIENEAHAHSLGERIDAATALFRNPVQIDTHSVPMATSFGICQGTGKNASNAIAQAILASRQNELSGKRWSIHSDDANSAMQRELILLADVDRAIEAGDIFVVYQPKMRLSDRRVIGAEALVRWQHPEFGPIAPDSFIPLLESSGNITQLTLSVLNSAIAELTVWRNVDPEMGVAVNVSASLLSEQEFTQALLDRVSRMGPMVTGLTLEVTESATIDQPEAAVAVLRALRAQGVRISIDDYGTGRATMTYLRAFPADEIKIDKSFVTHLLKNASDQVLVRSTVELAMGLNFKVVAEGAENEDVVNELAKLGCHYVQGWAIGKPMTGDAFRGMYLTGATLRAIA